MLAPNTNTLARIALTLLAAGGVVSALVWAGPLDPPSGAVSSTYKTLTEVEPRIAINATNTPGDADSLFKITQPGSYYLTGNITGVVGKHGIEIAASGVTLDLNGFDLAGAPAMGAFDGVNVTVSSLTNIEIRNGSIRNWGDEGIGLGSSLTTNSIIRGVRSSGNANVGIRVGYASFITGCTAFNNTGNGIYASYGSTISGCTAYDNTGNGIYASYGSTVSGCTAYYNTGDAIYASAGSTVSGCTAYDNTGNGIYASYGCTISGCTARGNTLDGINVSNQCIVLSNSCSHNGLSAGDGAGIHAAGNDNRIEGNNCTGADRGIDVDATGNIIIKNTCSGNTTNWDVVAGNTILVVQASSSGAVLGNAGGAAPGSTDPNANFTY